MRDDDSRDRRRILHFLARGPAAVRAGNNGTLLLDGGERGTIGVAARSMKMLHRQGQLARRGAFLYLSRAVPVAAAGPAGEEEETPPKPRINPDESPLAVLARMRDRNGVPYLEAAEIAAGERLRADFTHGALSPRLGVNWQSAGSGGGRGAADLSDSVLAARQRFNRALQAVGPELSGVLVDVCCFLKRLGMVETERGWPVRSAKLLLKAGLAALARHCGPPQRRPGTIRHWGAADYRPRLHASLPES